MRITQEHFQYIMYKFQQTLSLPFSLLRHYQTLECFFINNCCFWARATVLSRYRNCW